MNKMNSLKHDHEKAPTRLQRLPIMALKYTSVIQYIGTSSDQTFLMTVTT